MGLTATETSEAKPFLEPIELHPDISPSKRRPIDNLSVFPTRNGFSDRNGDYRTDCNDYDLTKGVENTNGGPSTALVSALDDYGIKVFDNGQEKRNYILDHNFSLPQIVRLGGEKVENGRYFVLDKGTTRGEDDNLYFIRDDKDRTSHFKEEELVKDRIKLEGIKQVGEIKRIGEYVLVTSNTEGDKTKLFVIDKEGKVVLSRVDEFRVERIVANSSPDKESENRFLMVTRNGAVIIEELVKKGDDLTFKYDSDRRQSRAINSALNMRRLRDISISGSNVLMLIDGQSGEEKGDKLIYEISKDGKTQNQKTAKNSVVGVTYLSGLAYEIANSPKGHLEVSLSTRS